MSIDDALNAAFGDRLTIPMAEVAELTGLATCRQLLADCRAGLVTHIERKGSRYMTRDHVKEFLAAHTRTGSSPQPAVSRAAADLEQARRFNARRSRPA